MKKFMQGLFVNFALIVLGTYVVISIIANDWSSSRFILELLLATVVIRLLLLLTNQFSSRYPVLEYLLEFGMVLTVVLVFDWLFGWRYSVDYLWVIIVTVAVVYAAVYAVGMGKIRRDVTFINEQITLRKKKDVDSE